MKRLLTAAALSAALAVTAAPTMAANVGVSISLGDPGFFGQINLGDAPAPPQLIYTQPVVVTRGPSYVADPVYLHVPAGEERHWRSYCERYNACGRPVYFVRDDWYQRQYAPHYRQRHLRAAPPAAYRAAVREQVRRDTRQDVRRDERRDQRDHRDHDHDRDYDHDHDHDQH